MGYYHAIQLGALVLLHQSYYQNTHDMKTDEVEEPAHPMGWHDDVPDGKERLNDLVEELSCNVDGECEACAI